MTCPEFESTLADYLDSTLPADERAAIEEHAASCSTCREFMGEVGSGLQVLKQADEIEPPAELITRLAYLAPMGRTRDPLDKQGFLNRIFRSWVLPVLQPRLAMGMAMTILSFAMLRRCTGVETQQIQSSDLSPVRVWGNVEDKALRARDQVVKYYDNLRVVYEIETHVKDLEVAQDGGNKQPDDNRTTREQKSNRVPGSDGKKNNGVGTTSRPPGGKQP